MPTARTYFRLGLTLAVLTALFLFWAIGALGIIGDGGRSDRVYLAVFATLVVGAGVARLRPRGMAYALVATAAAQVLVAVLALITGQQDTPGASVLEIVGLTALYAGLFCVSAWCFWTAAEGRAVS